MSVSGSRARAVVAATLLGGIWILQGIAATGAHGHAVLSSSDPAAGSTVDRLPATARLTFSEAVAQPTAVAVVAPDDSIVSVGAVEITENVVRQHLGGATGAGVYTITYRATSLDGHSLEGHLTFTVSGARGGAPVPGSAAPDPGGAGASVVGLSVAFAAALGLVVLGLNVLRRHV